MTDYYVIDRLISNNRLTREECLQLLDVLDQDQVKEKLAAEACRLREQYYGKKVYTRGLIEFTNYCRNNCYYCGIRRANKEIERYRMTEDEIMVCCQTGWQLGYRTFVLQGGEDPWFTGERIAGLVRKIKEAYPECALTLSIGEHDYQTYKLWKKAGADRYLLRHETASEDLYRKLHPESMSLANRIRCLRDLKALGYQVGAGFMVGPPGQTRDHLADDLMFLQDLRPEMVGIGPFIPHHQTDFAGEKAGSVDLTIALLSVIRLLLPACLLPATTALGTMDPLGREKGLMAGANVIMPNLSPTENRKLYELYDNKICVNDQADKCTNCLAERVRFAGYELVTDRGDFQGSFNA